MAEPVFYSFRRCPYAMRARLALLASGTACAIREVKLAAKPAELLAASPKGTVPVLVLPDGRVIDESLDIMRWALRRHDPDRWLDGDDGGLIASNDGPFKYHLDRYKYPHRHGTDAAEHRDAALLLLRPLEERLTRHPFLCGPRRSLTDAALMPFVRQYAETDRQWFDTSPLPALRNWLAGELATLLFARAMVRLPQWQAGSDPVPFGGGGGHGDGSQ